MKQKLIDIVLKDASESMYLFQEKGFITNLSVIRKDNNEITYKKKGKGIRKINKNYSLEFLDIHEKKDYACRLNDGSVIQIYYVFDNTNEHLKEASLKYFPNPGLELGVIYDLIQEENIEERKAYINEFTYDENFKRSSNYIRIDFKPCDKNEILHPSAHIHIGAKNELRLNVSRIPLVSEFIEFILFTYYKKEWIKYIFNRNDDFDLKQKDFFKKYNIDIDSYIKRRNLIIQQNMIDAELTENEKSMYTVIL